MTTSIADPLGEGSAPGYQIVARVGGGGMGVVYKARDLTLGRTVALKFLPPQWSHDEGAKQRFVREAQAAGATDHPNICTVHDIRSTPDGQLFIVMAYYDGETLKRRLERGALPIDEALEIATQVADGLAKAHSQGVVHRDVKPGNLMLTEDGVRILDFGLATFADALQLTTAGSTLGTAAYMSPEQVRGDDADARADVWAVGVVLYEMLTGHVPFRGAYAEAVSYAIRNETPAPLRTQRPEVSEEIEQLVFRAMHKDPAVRFQSGREMAKALRRVRGLTVPVDWRTEAVTVPARPTPAPLRPARSRWKTWGIAVALALLLVSGAATWLFWPVERTRIVVAPFGNQTGDPDLDQYRLALTQTLTLALDDSRDLSVARFGWVTEILGRFQQSGSDISDREAIQAITANTGATLVIVPTLLRDGGAWRARVQLRNGATATNVWEHETAAVTSSLSRDTAFRLAATVAGDLEGFLETRRSRVLKAMTGLVGSRRDAFAHVRSLDAAKAFADGTAWYEEFEYEQARRAFRSAVDLDPRNSLALTWLSRTALIGRDDNAATDAGERALSVITPSTPRTHSLFARAVAAEARRDATAAETLYRELVTERPDDAGWLMELAGFLDRQTKTPEAVAAYHDALRLDPKLLRPRLELCRLYNPSRLNEPADAKTHGQAALAGYRAIGARAAEGQSLWCLADTLRVGRGGERAEARTSAETALKIFEELAYPYSVARAEFYVALIAGVQGRMAESVAVGEKALAHAIESNNVPVQPQILNNLGAAYVGLGNRSMAADYYARAYKIYQSWREEARAARIQANRGAMLIDSGQADEGILDVRNALAVFEKIGDKNFEAFCARVIAVYYRNRGQHKDAITELNKGLAIAKERNLAENIALMTISLARSLVETGDYEGSRRSLDTVVQEKAGRRTTVARIQLAQTYVRLGDPASAQAEIERAGDELKTTPNADTESLLSLVRGQWAYEAGRRAEARPHFEKAAAKWGDPLQDETPVEAHAYLGAIDVLAGRSDAGSAMIRESVEAARKLGQLWLETRCRLLLAEAEIARGRTDAAAAALAAIPPDTDNRTIGPELRAWAHHWTGQIRMALGDAAGAARESSAARDLMTGLINQLPEQKRVAFQNRPAVKRLLQ